MNIHIETHQDGSAQPIIVCEHCARQITATETADALWPGRITATPNPVPHRCRVRYLHQSCRPAYERVTPTPPGCRWMAMGLREHLFALLAGCGHETHAEEFGDQVGFIIPWVWFGEDHEPFTVIPWTGNMRERTSENLDSPEWEGIAPDGQRVWFSASDSVLLKPEGRKGRQAQQWLSERRDALIANSDDDPTAPPAASQADLVEKLCDAAEQWELALAVSIGAVKVHGDEHHSGCYMKAECGLRDAIEAIRVAKGLPVQGDRVLPSFEELELAAREWMDGVLPKARADQADDRFPPFPGPGV